MRVHVVIPEDYEESPADVAVFAKEEDAIEYAKELDEPSIMISTEVEND